MCLHRNVEALEQELEQSSKVKQLLNTFNVKMAVREIISNYHVLPVCFTIGHILKCNLSKMIMEIKPTASSSKFLQDN